MLFAWMRTAILAGGIALVRSGVVYVEGGDEYGMLFFGDWATGLRLEQKKAFEMELMLALQTYEVGFHLMPCQSLKELRQKRQCPAVLLEVRH